MVRDRVRVNFWIVSLVQMTADLGGQSGVGMGGQRGSAQGRG